MRTSGDGGQAGEWFRSRLPLDDLPPRALALSAATSGMALIATFFMTWPLWGIVLAALLPWVPAVTRDRRWMQRHDGWMALFALLVITQGGHFLEHLIQMSQIHLLHWPLAEAHGVIGRLDIEWVHFLWNSAVLLAMAVLLRRYGNERWLWVSLVFAGWHQVEHVYLMGIYLETGVQGTPGLLATGGRLGGGLPLSRPDLHFLYNLVETAPLFIAFARVARQVPAAVAEQSVLTVTAPGALSGQAAAAAELGRAA